MSERYQSNGVVPVTPFLPWGVLDTQSPSGCEDYVCDCRTKEHAEMIAQALNAQEAARKRLEVVPAVVYQDANQNAPSATDGGKATGLEGGA